MALSLKAKKMVRRMQKPDLSRRSLELVENPEPVEGSKGYLLSSLFNILLNSGGLVNANPQVKFTLMIGIPSKSQGIRKQYKV